MQKIVVDLAENLMSFSVHHVMGMKKGRHVGGPTSQVFF